MTNYIATYFYHDSEDQGASYGNIFLPLIERNIIYWQTVYTFFFSSIVQNKKSEISYALFTNVVAFPFRDSIEALGVKIYDDLFLTQRNPDKWATVKFFFDVIDYIYENNEFKDDDGFVILDTDVVALGCAKPLFDCLQASKNAVAYVFEELSDNSRDFHGVNISDLEKIGLSAFGKETNIKSLIGGEFFCFNKRHISKLINCFKIFNNPNYSTQITTEEQILTLLNTQESWAKFPEGIYRVWTTLRLFDLPQENLNYIFLHLPSEKEFGLKKLFNATKNIDPNSMEESDFSLLFYRYLPLNRPYFLFVSKIISKIRSIIRPKYL